MVQILPEVPSFGTSFARSLGAGLSRGVEQGIDYAQKLNLQKQKMYAEQLQENEKRANEQKALNEYNNSNLDQQATDFSEPKPNKTKPNKTPYKLDRIEEVSEEKIKPQYLSDDISPISDVSQRNLDMKQRQQSKLKSYDITQKYRDTVNSEASRAQKENAFLPRALQLAESGDISDPTYGLRSMVSRYFPQAISPDEKEMTRMTKELIAGRARQELGSQLTGSEFFYLENAYPKSGETPESLARSINLQIALNKYSMERSKIANKFIHSKKGVPTNIENLVDEAMRPYAEKMLDSLGYYKWAAQNPEMTLQLKNEDERNELWKKINNESSPSIPVSSSEKKKPGPYEFNPPAIR